MTRPFGQEPAYIAAVRLTSCALSALGSLLIVWSYVLLRESRTFGRRLLVVLSVQDLLVAASYALPGTEGRAACRVQAAAISFFSCTSVMWTACIAFYIRAAARGSVPASELEARYGARFHAAVWPVAAAAAGVTVATPARFDEQWCWIAGSRYDFLTVYGVLWAAWAVCFYWYRGTARLLDGGGEGPLRRLAWVPLVLVAIRLPGSAHRVYRAAGGGSVEWLACLQAAGDPSQGFADALIFVVLNHKVRQELVRRACRGGGGEEGTPLVAG